MSEKPKPDYVRLTRLAVHADTPSECARYLKEMGLPSHVTDSFESSQVLCDSGTLKTMTDVRAELLETLQKNGLDKPDERPYAQIIPLKPQKP